MGIFTGKACQRAVVVALGLALVCSPATAQQASTQADGAAAVAVAVQSAESFREAYNALLDKYDQVFSQEGDARGQ